MVREPVVSGQFYPESKEELKELIEGFKPQESSKISAKGIIMPHAGYVYSGKVATTVVSKVLPKKKLIILGPNHRGLGENFALWAKGQWKIPFGNISIDQDLANNILDKGDCIKEDYIAHEYEHSIEVELPILHYFFGKFTFVPICCGLTSLDMCRKATDQLYAAVKEEKEDILFVASTDMTHYEQDSTARKKDRIAIESIINLDEEALLKNIRKVDITMCGFGAVAILIACMKKIGARKAQVAMYQTSGDTSGDYSSVVGYAGIIIN